MVERAHGFAPIIDEDCVVLVLGSMPSLKSLEEQQYYAHPRNAFWAALGQAVGFDVNEAYARRCAHLLREGVGVWDVLASCRRAGSLDSSIEAKSEVLNDFASLRQHVPRLGHVFLNGRKAETVWKRAIRRGAMPESMAALPADCLPSTSPAYASLTLSQKAAAWSIVVATARRLRS